MSRFVVLFGALCLITATPARAQAPSEPFEDVPPWHWAYEAVEVVRTRGLMIGYPPDDRYAAQNAVVQVLEAFAHPDHPQAAAWAERYLLNLPPDWPEPLRRSAVRAYSVEGITVRLLADRGTVELATTLRLADGRTASISASVRVQRDATGRWRADWTDLGRALPQGR
jgi:hypothetical protein